MRERKRNRKLSFDYSSEAIYFLTICAKNMVSYFGEVHQGEMHLNECGKIVKQQVEWLEKQYPYLILHNYIVMPNHVHILCEIIRVGRDQPVLSDRYQAVRSDRYQAVRSDRDQTVQIKIKSISELMGAFKTTSSKYIHRTGCIEFAWHRSFHDHIVRSNESYWKIFDYITDNPMNWKEDKFIQK
jgi:putative transposase